MKNLFKQWTNLVLFRGFHSKGFTPSSLLMVRHKSSPRSMLEHWAADQRRPQREPDTSIPTALMSPAPHPQKWVLPEQFQGHRDIKLFAKDKIEPTKAWLKCFRVHQWLSLVKTFADLLWGFRDKFKLLSEAALNFINWCWIRTMSDKKCYLANQNVFIMNWPLEEGLQIDYSLLG